MRKKIIVVSLIFILLVISIISIILLKPGTITENDKERINLKVSIPLCLLIAGESYPFEITNIPVDAIVVWDLGDGTETSATKPLISYEYAGNYNLTVKASWDEGEGVESFSLTVYNKDIMLEDSGDVLLSMDPSSVDSGGVEGTLLPGIVKPQIRITINLKEGTGSFHAFAYIHYTEFSTNQAIIEEDASLVRSDREWTVTLDRDQIQETNNVMILQAGLVAFNGKCGEWKVKCEAAYAYGLSEE